MTTPNPLDRLPVPVHPGGSAFGWHFLTNWSNCQTYWWNRNLRPHPDGGLGIEPIESRVPLAIGSAFHTGLEVWYHSGWADAQDTGERSLAQALSAARDALVAHGFDPTGDNEDAVGAWATLEELLTRYHSTYGPDGSQCEWPNDMVLSDTAGQPYIERELALDLGYHGYVLTARLDLIVLNGSHGLIAREHKTSAASLANRLLDRFELDGQATTQALMLVHHFPDQPIIGVEVNVAIKDRASKSPLPALIRRRTHRSDAQLEKFTLDARRKLGQIDAAVAYYESLMMAGMSADEAARVAFDGSPDGYQCVGAFGKCAFFDLCANRPISESIVAQQFRPRSYAHHWENPLAAKATVQTTPEGLDNKP